jgi:Uma2 family endonuclease
MSPSCVSAKSKSPIPLSPFSSVSRSAKCEEYHAWGVPFCWIVDPDDKQCWEYHSGDRLNQISDDGHLTAEKLSLGVTDIFADF